MINQANRRPGHATCLSTIRSKPFAPVFTFQKSHTCTMYIISRISPSRNKSLFLAVFFRIYSTFFANCRKSKLPECPLIGPKSPREKKCKKSQKKDTTVTKR